MDESSKWPELLSTLPELKAELLRQQAALRTERSAALVDFALDQTPANQTKLDSLNKRLASIDDTLEDLEVTFEEAKRNGLLRFPAPHSYLGKNPTKK